MTTRSPRDQRPGAVRGLVLGLALAFSAPALAEAGPREDVLVAVIQGTVDALHQPLPPERPRVLPPLRPEEPLATWRFDLEVPIAKQIGTKTNCGPTVAAMAVAAYALDPDAPAPETAPSVRELRDLIGEWTWQAFPMRQMRLPGYDSGMTTRHMMKTSMERFRPEVGWHPVEHAWLPLEAWSIVTLKKAVAERRPLVVLAEARTLWGLDVAGLHWVVVTGLDQGQVRFNDPADGAAAAIPLERFWTAWRLSPIYRSLPMVAGFEALLPDRSLPLNHVPAPDLRPERLPPAL
ncbi:MAG TPA: papain-like cysteine protease family protein [Myxococcota bacterium]|nr:papain-like cysteine protease family protein [Myxococcota bacterium]